MGYHGTKSILWYLHRFSNLFERLAVVVKPCEVFKECCDDINMGDDKKKETKIEKKDEFGNVIEKQEIEEKEED
jgi:hypothetical protein